MAGMVETCISAGGAGNLCKVIIYFVLFQFIDHLFRIVFIVLITEPFKSQLDILLFCTYNSNPVFDY